MKIIIKNLATEYKDDGAGRTMLFLHGWQDNLETFKPLAGLFASDFRIIRLDLPGFGKTENPPQDWNLEDYVHFVRSFIEKLGVEVNVLIGHSFGGRIAIKALGEKKIKTDKIVLLNSAGIVQKHTLRSFLLKVFAKVIKAVLFIPPLSFWKDKIRKKAYRAIGSDYADVGRLKGTFLNTINEDLSGQAKNISVPTLLIWGVNDEETPLSLGRYLSRLIPGSNLEVIENAGHFVHKEKPEEVAERIKKFIS